MAFYYSHGKVADHLEELKDGKRVSDNSLDTLLNSDDNDVPDKFELKKQHTTHRRNLISGGIRRARYVSGLGDFRFGKMFSESTNANDKVRYIKWRNQQSLLSASHTIRGIFFNKKGHVSYGTWESLIIYLTQLGRVPEEFIHVFLTTFRTFATAKDLAEALVARGSLLPPSGLTASETKFWRERKLRPVQQKVFAIIHEWVESYWYPETDHPYLPMLYNFLVDDYSQQCRFGTLAKVYNRVLQIIQKSLEDATNITSNTRASDSPYYKNGHVNDNSIINALGDDVESVNLENETKTKFTKVVRYGCGPYDGELVNGPNNITNGSGYNGDATADIKETDGHVYMASTNIIAPINPLSSSTKDENVYQSSQKWLSILKKFIKSKPKYNSSAISNNNNYCDSKSAVDIKCARQRSFKKLNRKADNDWDKSKMKHRVTTQPNSMAQGTRKVSSNSSFLKSRVSLASGLSLQKTKNEEDDNNNDGDTDDMNSSKPSLSTLWLTQSAIEYNDIDDITKISPADVACQLTLIESKCFCKIRPQDLIFRYSNRSCLPPNTDLIRRMSQWNTQLSYWISSTILNELTPERRCHMMKYFIQLGTECLSLKNYDAVMAIKAAIFCSAVMRLKQTWALLPNKFNAQCHRLHKALDPDRNYANYRSNIRCSSAPLLPFLGLYLTDLTFVEDGNPPYRVRGAADPNTEIQDKFKYDPFSGLETVEKINQNTIPQRKVSDIKDTRVLINFDRAYRISGIIDEIQRFQIEYSGDSMDAIPELQQMLLDQWEECEANGYDDDKIYNMSLEREPRVPVRSRISNGQNSALKLSRLLPKIAAPQEQRK